MENETIISLYYYKDKNWFEDGNGFIIENLLQYVRPYMLTIFFYFKEYQCFEIRPGRFVELFWPDDDEEEYFD